MVPEDDVVEQLVPASVRDDEPLTAEEVIVAADSEPASLEQPAVQAPATDEPVGDVVPFPTRPPVPPAVLPPTARFDALSAWDEDDERPGAPVPTPRDGLPDVPHLYAVLDDTGETPPVRD